MSLNSVFQKALFSTVRIRTVTETGRVIHGTGFVYEYVSDDNTFPFLVTASSLVSNASEGRMALMQANGKEPLLGKGYTLDIDQFSRLWYSHPDRDAGISVTPFVPFVRHIENTGIRIFFNAFMSEDLASSESFEKADFGDERYVVGYPTGYWDSKNLLPVTRKTSFASFPGLDYQKRNQRLMDMQSLSGWTGSPVVERHEENVRLAGILCQAGVNHQEDPDLQIADENSMSVMLKYDAIIEVIMAYLKEKGFI